MSATAASAAAVAVARSAAVAEAGGASVLWIASCPAARAGVTLNAPLYSPAAIAGGRWATRTTPAVSTAPSTTTAVASPFSRSPSDRSDATNPGPSCSPRAYTNRTRAKLLK